MDLTIDELLQGKSTIIRDKEYFPTKTYVEPFIERMSKYTDDFVIKALTPSQLSVTKNNPDIVYNRVWVQAILPDDYTEENHAQVYGLVYGLDPKIPRAKLYRANLNLDYMSLFISDSSWMTIQEIEEKGHIDFKPLNALASKDNEAIDIIKKMKNTTLKRSDYKSLLGNWGDFVIRDFDDSGFGIVKIPHSTVTKSYKQLFVDKNDKHYIPEDENPSLFNIYNSFSEIITNDKRDILNTVDKTLLLSRMLEIKRV